MIWDVMAYVLSAFTLANLWLAGNVHPWTWRVGLVGQALWFVFVIGTQQWGLMIGVVGIAVVMIRNEVKWRKNDASV
ncbi:hypothetical protein FDH38_gp011 [Dinoroseobacter phage vB_DshS-R5C]|uniref:Uncharacterized protein n=1 Tax=Dinoroseobacter phage vB_DshS-R5C TaxID=1965368 RepID=A0A1V0DY34_9CAUD|nr:hypothetical protein FDH38_gp011 [Dinoroseobacter phage vB_DshS-R5C]ARB06065.1 hypothetical protein vBDshSR5C_11 [Dinoroseobacter phage vB_DshS-R5C]